MTKRCLVLQASLVACVALAGCGRETAVAPQALPPTNQVTPSIMPALTNAVAVPEEPVIGQAVAKLKGSSETPIRALVAGFLIKQNYTEGARISAGDLLFEIDARPTQADAATNSGRVKITAPVAGVAGRAIPGVGDLVRPGDTLATISALDPIEAEFAIPAAYYRDHADWIAKILAQSPAVRPENIQLILGDGTVYAKPGRLASIDIDTKTSTKNGVVTACASFPNPDGLLRPGQYVRVRGVAAHK